MDTAGKDASGTPRGPVLVERFPPTSGRATGIVCALLLALGAGAAALRGDSVGAAAAAVGLAWCALVMHVALIRPTMHAYEDHLRLRNMLTDTEVPWHLVDGVVVRQTTRVHVGDEVHHAIGVGRKVRELLRGSQRDQMDRSAGMLAHGRLGASSEGASLEDAQGAGNFPDYVQTRLADLARSQSAASLHRERVRLRWALPETFGLATLTVLFVVFASLAWLG